MPGNKISNDPDNDSLQFLCVLYLDLRKMGESKIRLPDKQLSMCSFEGVYPSEGSEKEDYSSISMAC